MYGNVNPGSDGNLLAEFKMMEKYIFDMTGSNTYDAYTCAVQEQPFWECLDISSSRTLGGSYKNDTIFDMSSDLNVLQQAAAQMENAKSLFGRLGEQIDLTSTNYFGSDMPCQGGSGDGDITGTTYNRSILMSGQGSKNYGDGVVNAFDMASLMWVQFAQQPYDALSRNFVEIATVQGRDDTAWRCNRGETKSQWMAELGNNYCAGPTEETGALEYSRRLAEGAAGLPLPMPTNARADKRRELMQRQMQKLDMTLQAAQPGAADNLGFEVVEWAKVRGEGRWVRIRPDKTLLVVELFLAGFAMDGGIPLSNDPTPDYNCDDVLTCTPRFQPNSVPAIMFKRRLEYAEAGLSPALRALASAQCAEIVPGNDPQTAFAGNVLSVRQQPLTKACPFDLYLWIPEKPARGTYIAKNAEPFSQEADMLTSMGATPPARSEEHTSELQSP